MTHFTLTPGCKNRPSLLRPLSRKDTCDCPQGEKSRIDNHDPDAITFQKMAAALAIKASATRHHTWPKAPELLLNSPPCQFHTTQE